MISAWPTGILWQPSAPKETFSKMNQQLPVEVAEFEQLLRKPNSDPTGFAGFFNSGEFQLIRAQGIQCRRHAIWPWS